MDTPSRMPMVFALPILAMFLFAGGGVTYFVVGLSFALMGAGMGWFTVALSAFIWSYFAWTVYDLAKKSPRFRRR